MFGEDSLIMPSDEMVRMALKLIGMTLEGQMVPEPMLLSARAVLDAYARLRPLEPKHTSLN